MLLYHEYLRSGFRRDIAAISLGLSPFAVWAMFWFCVSQSDDRKSYIQFWLWSGLVIVKYNYFILYKASSLTLKIIWPKRVSFFVFLRCRIFILRSHGSRLSAIVRSDSICFYWNGWMKIDRFPVVYKSCSVTYKSCQRESKIATQAD